MWRAALGRRVGADRPAFAAQAAQERPSALGWYQDFTGKALRRALLRTKMVDRIQGCAGGDRSIHEPRPAAPAPRRGPCGGDWVGQHVPPIGGMQPLTRTHDVCNVWPRMSECGEANCTPHDGVRRAARRSSRNAWRMSPNLGIKQDRRASNLLVSNRLYGVHRSTNL
jgi:hypothetical protein